MKEISEALLKVADRLFAEVTMSTDLETVKVLLHLHTQAVTYAHDIDRGAEVSLDEITEFFETVKALN